MDSLPDFPLSILSRINGGGDLCVILRNKIGEKAKCSLASYGKLVGGESDITGEAYRGKSQRNTS